MRKIRREFGINFNFPELRHDLHISRLVTRIRFSANVCVCAYVCIDCIYELGLLSPGKEFALILGARFKHWLIKLMREANFTGLHN